MKLPVVAVNLSLVGSIVFSPMAEAQSTNGATNGATSRTTGGAAGTYCLEDVREVGSCIRLHPDGRFQYFLAHGAYDEKSQGRWRAEGEKIVLESAAYGKKPRFVFKGFKKAATDSYSILIEDKSGEGIAGIDILAKCGSKVSEGYTQYDGFKTSCTDPLQELSIGIFMVGLDYQPVSVAKSSNSSKVYIYQFEPGDLGKKPFLGTRLSPEGADTLTMIYGDSPLKGLVGKHLKFKRQK